MTLEVRPRPSKPTRDSLANPASPDAATLKGRRPWKKEAGLKQVLDDWRERRAVADHISLRTELPAKDANFAAWPALSEASRKALEARGIESLFSHQARAIELARKGASFVVATPTASGKSLCFNVPVMEAFAADANATALYLFPTKALGRDQEEALRSMLGDAGLKQGAITYDGDTPGDARRVARERSGVLITNPDMLHAGILPHHTRWARLFANLKYVVIDELHMYRGVFGSHLANVMRRLKRIAAFHGASPQFILASATIANPAEHASRITGEKVRLIDEHGAPEGKRSVVVYNPPVINTELGIRQSYLKASVRLTTDLIREGVSTLVFAQTRNAVEVMVKYLRDRTRGEPGIDARSIMGYRGGYLPKTRREIEARLRDGDIRCVVATNALELGIDIGALDAVVCAGYPGSLAALWQRFGRGGRRKQGSLAVLVASSATLDQYFATFPERLIETPVEEARIDPDNVEILLQHLKCAAFELPFEAGADFGDLPGEVAADAIQHLAEGGLVHLGEDGQGRAVYHWSDESYPASHVSLRSYGWDNFVVIDVSTDKTIAEMDWRSAHTMLHEEAIYQHDGAQYQVEKLDYDHFKAFVRPVEPDYFTTAHTHTKVEVLDREEEAQRQPGIGVGLGEVSVVDKVVGSTKIKYHTHENVGYGEVRLPEMQMHTVSYWLTFSHLWPECLGVARPAFVDALRGLAKAMHTVAAIRLMTDPRDLGFAVQDEDIQSGDPAELFDPSVFIYDAIPGGVGLAPRVFDDEVSLLEGAEAVALGCRCTDGCPSCIGPARGEVEPGARRRVLRLIFEALKGERLLSAEA